jgi:hypothetical protein
MHERRAEGDVSSDLKKDGVPPHGHGDRAQERENMQEVHQKPFPMHASCEFCGLRNYLSKDCKHRPYCELCGLDTHSTFSCNGSAKWNVGPKLCAVQVEGQIFFQICKGKG